MDTYDNAAEQFLDGSVDAWVGSYPYLTSVEEQVKVRGLIPTEGLFTHRSLWFTSRSFATERPDELAAIVERAAGVGPVDPGQRHRGRLAVRQR